jgi:sporulation protein YabP
MSKNNPTTGSHSFSLENRKLLDMSGIKEVASFNEDKIILQTNQGTLFIKGKKLNIQKLNLDDGSIKIEGLISSLDYSDKDTTGGLFNKLFR